MRKKSLMQNFIQFVKFNIVGVMNTLVDMGVFWVLTSLVGLDRLTANPISYGFGVINSFIFNRAWTFRESSKGAPVWQYALKFIVVNMVSWGASQLILWWGTENLTWPEIVVKLIATVVAVIINFIGSRLWVFRGKNASLGDTRTEHID